MTDTDVLTSVREHAVRSWQLFTHSAGLHALVSDWRSGVTPDGSPRLTVEVVGPDAAQALHRFSAEYMLILGQPGDQRPHFDVDVPGRTVLVWRHKGVWVELWHPETITQRPSRPEPGPAAAQGLLTALGGRLPFTRNRSPKETTTA
ncbi:hypothetical protein [Streptomyces griseosporeus]